MTNFEQNAQLYFLVPEKEFNRSEWPSTISTRYGKIRGFAEVWQPVELWEEQVRFFEDGKITVDALESVKQREFFEEIIHSANETALFNEISDLIYDKLADWVADHPDTTEEGLSDRFYIWLDEH